jgi:hypothetical protein
VTVSAFEFLFALHEKLTAPLIAAAKPKKGARSKQQHETRMDSP